LLNDMVMQWCDMVILLSPELRFGGCIYRAKKAVFVLLHDPTISPQVVGCATVTLKLHDPSRGKVEGYIGATPLNRLFSHMLNAWWIILGGDRGPCGSHVSALWRYGPDISELGRGKLGLVPGGVDQMGRTLH
jgi:hypothetical protein